jgi:hypothetical protein
MHILNSILSRAKLEIIAKAGRSQSAISDKRGEIFLHRAVVMKVNEGLANQMICYKAGRFLAELNSATLILDATWYGSVNDSGPRNYQLHHHAIRPDLTVFDPAIMQDIFSSNEVRAIEREDFPSGYAKSVPDLMYLSQGCQVMVAGFWAALHLRNLADEYFEKNCMLGELDLSGPEELGDQDTELLLQIRKSPEPVAIHVRRGDYATHDGGLLLTQDYYNRSISKVISTLSNPSFFVFSDDPRWCKANIKTDAPIWFVDWNTDQTGYRDLYLASRCRHFILSNESTFSHQIVQLSRRSKDTLVISSSKSDIDKRVQTEL